MITTYPTEIILVFGKDEFFFFWMRVGGRGNKKYRKDIMAL